MVASRQLMVPPRRIKSSKGIWHWFLTTPAPWEVEEELRPVDLETLRRASGRPRHRAVMTRGGLRRLRAAQKRLTALRKRRAQERAKSAANKCHEMRRAKQGRAG